MIAVAAGEAQDPQAAITSAFRSALLRLVFVLWFDLGLGTGDYSMESSGAG